MKVTVKAALEMAQAIGQLDGYQNGSAERLTPYKYDGATRLRIANARRKLRAIVEDYQEARNAILIEISDGAGSLSPISPAMSHEERSKIAALHMAFDKRDKELLAATVDFDVAPLTSEQLKLDDNPIPPSVLDLLGDLVTLT